MANPPDQLGNSDLFDLESTSNQDESDYENFSTVLLTPQATVESETDITLSNIHMGSHDQRGPVVPESDSEDKPSFRVADLTIKDYQVRISRDLLRAAATADGRAGIPVRFDVNGDGNAFLRIESLPNGFVASVGMRGEDGSYTVRADEVEDLILIVDGRRLAGNGPLEDLLFVVQGGNVQPASPLDSPPASAIVPRTVLNDGGDFADQELARDDNGAFSDDRIDHAEAVNDGPVALDASLEASEDGAAVTGQLVASDVDGDSLTFSLVEGPGEGSVTIHEDGSYSYDPGSGFQDLAAGESRDVTFTYQVDDGHGGTSEGTATVTVSGTNDGPVALDDTFDSAEDNTFTISAEELLTNDTDLDGDTLTVTAIEQPEHGSIVDNGNGTYTYTPEENWNGEVDFTYTVTDGQGGTANATFAITVAGIVDAAEITVEDLDAAEDTVFDLNLGLESVDKVESIALSGIPEGGVLKDANGNEIEISGGVANISQDQVEGLTIKPPTDSNENFTLTLSVTTSDNGETATTAASFDVNVAGVADAPFVESEDVTATQTTQTIDINLLTDMATALAEGGTEPYSLPDGGGLAGHVYDANSYLGNLDTVDTLIANNDPSISFTATNVDYEGGNTIGEFLGDDGTSAEGAVSASAETFAVQLTGYIHLEAGTHTFATRSDDGFRLRVGGETVTQYDGNRAPGTSSGTFVVSEPGLYPIDVTYWEQGGGQVLDVVLNGQTISDDMLYSEPPSGVVLESDGHYSIPDEIGGAPANLIVEVPYGATLSAGSDNGDGTWMVSAADAAGLQMTLREGDAGPHELSLSVVDGDGDILAADTMEAGDGIFAEAPLGISALLNDTDGSETLSVTISGVPDGAVLSAGTENADGTWTLTPEELDGLTIGLPESAEDFVLSVTATATENDGDTAASTVSLTVTVPENDTLAEGVTLTGADATGAEDTAIVLDIGLSQLDTDGSETVSVTLSGIPDGAVLKDGDGNEFETSGGSVDLSVDQLEGLTITPPPDSNADFDLTVRATTTESSSGDTAVSTASLHVSVAGVADSPDLSVAVGEGTANVSPPPQPVAYWNLDETSGLTLNDQIASRDGTSHGKNSWRDDLDLNDSTNLGGAHSSVSANLNTGAEFIDGDRQYVDVDHAAALKPDNGAVTLWYNSDESNDGTLISNNAFRVSIRSDGSLKVDMDDGSGSTSIVGGDVNEGNWNQITVTWGEDGLSLYQNGTFVVGDAGFTGGLSSDTSDWIFGANLYDRNSVNDYFDGHLDDIALFEQSLNAAQIEELYELGVGNYMSDGTGTNLGTTFPVIITTSLRDIDGSETLSISIADVPDGVTFSAGSDNGDGTWSFTAAELAGLEMTVPSGTEAFDLNVRATATEDDGDTRSVTATATVETVVQGVDIEVPNSFDISGSSSGEYLGWDTGDTAIDAGDGNDNVYGDSHYYRDDDGNDVILAGGGDDTVYGGGGADQIDGGEGHDTIFGDLAYAAGQAGDDLIDGGAGNDSISGGSGADTIAGGEGNDDIDGDYRGYYDASGDGDTIHAEGGDDTVYGGDGADTVYGGDGDDVLVGGARGDEDGDWSDSKDGADYLNGGAGNDIIRGGIGNDTLVGGEGNDTIFGGDGEDLFVFGEGDGNDVIDGGQGWLDTVHLENVQGGPGEGAWDLELDSGAIEEQADGYVALTDDASGKITFADGAELDFDSIERIEW